MFPALVDFSFFTVSFLEAGGGGRGRREGQEGVGGGGQGVMGVDAKSYSGQNQGVLNGLSEFRLYPCTISQSPTAG